MPHVVLLSRLCTDWHASFPNFNSHTADLLILMYDMYNVQHSCQYWLQHVLQYLLQCMVVLRKSEKAVETVQHGAWLCWKMQCNCCCLQHSAKLFNTLQNCEMCAKHQDSVQWSPPLRVEQIIVGTATVSFSLAGNALPEPAPLKLLHSVTLPPGNFSSLVPLSACYPSSWYPCNPVTPLSLLTHYIPA